MLNNLRLDLSCHGIKLNSFRRLNGGINNEVYACKSDKGSFIVKKFNYPNGTRNKLKAEAEFLKYANIVAQEFVPKLILEDTKKRIILMEIIEGKRFAENRLPTHDQIKAAISFFRKLNCDKSIAKDVITLNAAEAFECITDHCNNIRQRIDRMSIDHLPSEFILVGSDILKRLNNNAEELSANINNLIHAEELQDYISKDQFCISPSDFGFHNAIYTDEGVKFIDFEFAGWDDPMKATIDFFLQPQLPVPERPYYCLDPYTRFEELRYKKMREVLQLKWVCIILSILNKQRLEEISNRSGSNTIMLIEKRIKLALSLLS